MTFHSETDRQSEIVKMERHLDTFINYQQDDWVDKCPIAMFMANNNVFSSTKLSPFFTLRGLYPCMSCDIVNLSDTTTGERINKKKAIDISEII